MKIDFQEDFKNNLTVKTNDNITFQLDNCKFATFQLANNKLEQKLKFF